MSLPGRDLPGISARPRPPRFATDFAPRSEGVQFGHLMDGGEALHHELRLASADLTRHMFITGLTGSGKSTTSRWLLGQLLERRTPLLIIEPAKTEYLEWGLRLRRRGVPVRLYCPGRTRHQGEALDELALNPFEVPEGYEVLSHVDRLKAVMTAAFPMQEVLPILLEAALMRVYEEQGWLDDDRLPDLPPPRLRDLEQAVVRTLGDRESGYAEEVRRNLQTALLHRLRSLRQGFKGRLLDQPRSTPLAELFDGVAVVNLSTLTADADKSLVMGLLMGLLYEHRIVQGASPDGGLRHVTMVEEAHRILRAPRGDPHSPQAHTAEAFADLLAEVRAYGEGLIIVDQVPAKLIPDALKNTFVKVVHRLQARDDQEALAAAMGLTPEQVAAIPLLEQGQAIVQAGHRAALVQIPAPREEA
nr:ATP-binding protein [Deinococcus aestuarii]